MIGYYKKFKQYLRALSKNKFFPSALLNSFPVQLISFFWSWSGKGLEIRYCIWTPANNLTVSWDITMNKMKKWGPENRSAGQFVVLWATVPSEKRNMAKFKVSSKGWLWNLRHMKKLEQNWGHEAWTREVPGNLW